MIAIDYLREYLGIHFVKNVPDEVLIKVYGKEYNLIQRILEDIGKCAVIWSVEDFECRAEEKKGENWRDFYDETKFEDALESMIHHHDAEYGITWGSVDFYLDEMCIKKEEEDDEE